MNRKFKAWGLAIVFGSILILPSAKADEWNKATAVTLNAPVAIPGKVLEPGRYVFEVADSQVDRNIVKILNADRTQIIATVLTISAVRVEPTNDTVIKMMNREGAGPQAIGTWFFAGDYRGVTFLYPGE